MSNYPLVKFVDAPAVGATVRLDLNDGSASAPRRVEAEFDLGVPTLEGDPDAVGQVFGFRSPRFTVQVRGTKANALAFVSALSKELLRRTNWLLFQPSSATQPVWFKTYRTGYQSLSFEQVYENTTTGGAAPAGYPDVWRVELPLVAEALAYGARDTQANVTLIQSAADSGGNKALRIPLTGLKGDAPTDLRISIAPGSPQLAGHGSAWLIGCVSGTSAMTEPIVNIGSGDGFTAGSGTAAATTGATTYFGNDYRAVTVSAGSNFIERLSGSLPAMPRGRYKVLLRCQADTAANVARPYIFAFGQRLQSSAGIPIYGPTTLVTVGHALVAASELFQGWVDLGDFNFPFGLTAPRDLPDAAASSLFSVKIGTSDQTVGAVRIDSLKFVPIDGPWVSQATMLRAQFGTANPAEDTPPIANSGTGIFDGDEQIYYALDGSANHRPGSPQLKGTFPRADPAQTQNLLYLIAVEDGLGSGVESGNVVITTKDASATVSVSYHPRYLHVGDGT